MIYKFRGGATGFRCRQYRDNEPHAPHLAPGPDGSPYYDTVQYGQLENYCPGVGGAEHVIQHGNAAMPRIVEIEY